MLMDLLLFVAFAMITPPTHLHRQCDVTKPDGRSTVVQLFAQDELMSFEGTRWWLQVEGHSYRLDTYGFESNYGPLYQSPQGNQVIIFQSFRNTFDGGLCFDLVTGQVTETEGTPLMFEAKGWKRLNWEPAANAK